MVELQKRIESKIMIRGLLSVIIIFVKHIFNYEIPNEILDTAVEFILSVYTVYAVGNSPRLKNQY